MNRVGIPVVTVARRVVICTEVMLVGLAVSAVAEVKAGSTRCSREIHMLGFARSSTTCLRSSHEVWNPDLFFDLPDGEP